ncbi:MAG: hypothetical protein ACYSO7_09965 [Planctomycetota bacterium]|jgi:hypothetical protein
MAYKRNLSFPLAPTFGEDKPKKKRTTSYGEGSKTVKKRSGATKKTTISDMGRKKTVTKTSKKGVTTSRTKTISPDYKSATYTKKKDGKVVSSYTSTPNSPEERRIAAEMDMSGIGGDYYGMAKRQRRKAVKFTPKPSKIKAKQESERGKKKAAKAKAKAEWNAMSPEEKKRLRKNTRQKRSGKIRNKVMPVLRKIGLAKRSAQVTSKKKKTKSPKDNKGKAMSNKDVKQCLINDDC